MDPVHATDNNYLLDSDDNFCSGGETLVLTMDYTHSYGQSDNMTTMMFYVIFCSSLADNLKIHVVQLRNNPHAYFS